VSEPRIEIHPRPTEPERRAIEQALAAAGHLPARPRARRPGDDQDDRAG
jgi:hypothetical protein